MKGIAGYGKRKRLVITLVMFRIIIPCLMMELSEQTKEHKWHHQTSVDRIPGVSWLYSQLQLQQTWPALTVLTPCPWKNVWLAGWLVYMCKLYQNTSKLTHYPSIKRWPLAKKMTKNTRRNNCDSWCRKHLDTRTCHSPNLPHQHMFLDSRRRCRSQILGGHVGPCCNFVCLPVWSFLPTFLPKKNVAPSLSTQSRNRLVRSNCQEVDIGSEGIAQWLADPYSARLRLLSQWLESYRRTKDQRVPKSIGLRFRGCMCSIIWPVMLSTSKKSLVPHLPTIITPKRDARRIFHGEIGEIWWNIVKYCEV